MKEITLKEYFKIKQINKNNRGLMNYSDFAAKVGVSVSYISKLINNVPMSISKRGKFKLIADYAAKDGYTLIQNNDFSKAQTNLSKENKRLEELNKELLSENYTLHNQLRTYKSLLDIAKAIIKYEENLEAVNIRIKNLERKR